MGKKVTSFLVFISFLFFWFSIFIGSGALFSGYHLADDHEILGINDDLASTQNDVIEVMKKWVKNNYSTMRRFKPVYYLHRVMEALFYGTNINLWLLHTGFLAVFTSFFLFTFMYKIGFSLLESVLFPLLSLVGEQAVLWWSLGPNETIGMFCMSVSLLFMAYSIYSDGRRFIYTMFFVIFAILMSLSKESFILLIPALLFWNIWLYQQKNGVSFFISIKRNIFAVATLSIFMFAELLIIVTWVGTGGLSHGGGLDGFKPLSYLRIAKDVTFSVSTMGLGLVIITSILLMIFNSAEDSLYIKIKRPFKNLYLPGILSILIVFPQFIIYARSGVFGRYIIPLILGYSIFLIYLIQFFRVNSAAYSIKLPDKNINIASLLCATAGIFLLFTGTAFLYNHELRLQLFSGLGKPIPAGIVDVLKPGILAISSGVFVIYCAGVVKKNSKRLALANMVTPLVIAAIFSKTMLAFAGAYEFSLNGKYINSLFQSVKDNTKSDDKILIVADPGITNNNEAGWSIKVYLNHVSKRENIYVYPIFVNDADNADWAAQSYEKMFENKSLSSIEDKAKINYIIIFRELEQKFLISSKDWFNITNLTRNANDMFVIYIKNNAQRM